jgi:hypothetical protein
MSSSSFSLIWTGQCGLSLAAFMDIRDLCAAEQAGLNAQSCTAASRQIADEHRAVVVPWHPKQRECLASLVGKAWLRAFAKLRQATAGVPVSWAPYITSSSDSRISVLPMPAALPIAVTQRAEEVPILIPDANQRSGSEDVANPQCNVPPYAGVALAIGMKKGFPFTAGVSFSSESSLMSGCFLGVEMAGVDDYLGLTIAVSLEVTSGRVFVEYPSFGPTMVASVMPCLSWNKQVRETAVDVWCVIQPCGSLTFFRRCISDGCETVCTSGFLSSRSFPNWTAEFHVSVNFDTQRLEVPTQASVLWVGPEMPRGDFGQNLEVSECESIWSLYEPEEVLH